MREYLFELLETSGGDLSAETIVLRLVMSAVIAAFLFLSYRLSHSGSIYSAKFNVSLVALTVITTTVMIVIGNNIALSLGMVGALSIVRFRTAIKDSRDTIYIFWAIVVGICCGAGDYLVAAAGSAVVFLVLLLFGRIRSDNRALLILRAARINESRVESLIFQYYNHKAIHNIHSTGNGVAGSAAELSECLHRRLSVPGPRPVRYVIYILRRKSGGRLPAQLRIDSLHRPDADSLLRYLVRTESILHTPHISSAAIVPCQKPAIDDNPCTETSSESDSYKIPVPAAAATFLKFSVDLRQETA